MSNKGVWEVREWDGATWPDKRISVGWSDGGNAICISPRYAEREETLRLFKIIAAAPETEAERDWLKEANESLVEALEMMLAISGGVEQGSVVYSKALEALNKAIGEQE